MSALIDHARDTPDCAGDNAPRPNRLFTRSIAIINASRLGSVSASSDRGACAGVTRSSMMMPALA